MERTIYRSGSWQSGVFPNPANWVPIFARRHHCSVQRGEGSAGKARLASFAQPRSFQAADLATDGATRLARCVICARRPIHELCRSLQPLALFQPVFGSFRALSRLLGCGASEILGACWFQSPLKGPTSWRCPLGWLVWPARLGITTRGHGRQMRCHLPGPRSRVTAISGETLGQDRRCGARFGLSAGARDGRGVKPMVHFKPGEERTCSYSVVMALVVIVVKLEFGRAIGNLKSKQGNHLGVHLWHAGGTPWQLGSKLE